MRQNVQENAKISDNDSQLPDGNSWKINADHRLSAVREVADEILTFADMAQWKGIIGKSECICYFVT